MKADALPVDGLFASVATSDAGDPAVGVVWWARHPSGSFEATILDYAIAETAEIDANWMHDTLDRGAELALQYRPAAPGCNLRVEQPGLRQVLEGANAAYHDSAEDPLDQWKYRIEPIKDYESAKWPATFVERAVLIRQLVNSGRIIRSEKHLRKFNFRAVKGNHLIAELKRFRPGEPATGSGLLTAFVLGALIAKAKRSASSFSRFAEPTPAAGGSFGAYIPGSRPR
jgi:hypothetical protein